jgi:predicted dehydrogenase
MKKVKLGIIGCGVIGINHVKGALSAPDRVELTALCDIRPEAVKAAATQYKVPKAYTNPDELLADPDVEAVVLAIPLKGRPELGVKVLKAGKHLLMEKPLVRNMAEARALLAARGERVVACCSARHSVYPSARAAAKVVSDGLLGKVRLIRARGITACGPKPKNPPPVWRVSKELNGGGILVNWGVYDLDYLLSIVGWSVRPQTVLAQTWRAPEIFRDRMAPGSDGESLYAAIVRCQGGEMIVMERGEFVASSNDVAWSIIGEKGTIHLNLIPDVGKKLLLDEATPDGVKSRVVWEGDENWDSIHITLVPDFADAILQHRAPYTSLEQGMVIQQITDAIYASAESGRAVTIE